MPACYWTLCHCPDAQPCVEHTGLECGVLGGHSITSESQVQDALTSALEAAILGLDADMSALQRIRTELEAKKAALERDKEELQRAADAAQSRSDRRAVIDRYETIVRTYEHLADELRAVMDEINTKGLAANAVVARGTSRLIRPYADTSGYCTCYGRKRQRLAVIAGQIAAEQATLGSLQTQYNNYRAQVLPDLRVVFTLAFSWVIAMYIFFGINLWLSALIAGIVVAIILIVMIIDVATMQANIVASRQRLARLVLAYYRIQQIPTCKQAPPEDDELDEWLWWLWFWGWLEGEQEPSPGEQRRVPGRVG